MHMGLEVPWTSQDKYAVGDGVRVRQGDGSWRDGKVEGAYYGGSHCLVRYSDDGSWSGLYPSLKADRMEICPLKAPQP